jgi:hypothetical protein
VVTHVLKFELATSEEPLKGVNSGIYTGRDVLLYFAPDSNLEGQAFPASNYLRISRRCRPEHRLGYKGGAAAKLSEVLLKSKRSKKNEDRGAQHLQKY